MCSAVRSKGRQLAALRVACVVAAWREFLEISQIVETEPISPFQVTGENGRSGAALIGVCSDAQRATIYHTRALTVEDIIHELLHVAHPTWSEAHVVYETDRSWRRGLMMPPPAPTREQNREAA
jgi:hypothetical protein